MKKYKSTDCFIEIDEVEVDRETTSSVWVNGMKRAKTSDFHCYHDSYEEAKALIMSRCQMKVDRLKCQLMREEQNLARAKSLTQIEKARSLGDGPVGCSTGKIV